MRASVQNIYFGVTFFLFIEPVRCTLSIDREDKRAQLNDMKFGKCWLKLEEIFESLRVWIHTV